MQSERWNKVKEIVAACLEMEPARRTAYLSSACREDASLMSEVESLLASCEDAGDFLQRPLLEDYSEELLTGRRIGPYRVAEVIGQGGMGKVYRGVRASEFEKQVAIKVVKRGMDTDFILRRFYHEREILARLDHPNIARLLDGGATDDGRPYLVMEYIEGAPITQYFERHGLGLEQRLQLFRTVCSAVQYAHQHLVVHRDLKPSNILVTTDGEPKLLDFGIAKLMDSGANHTMTSQRLLTPECASPEQIRGEAVTTAGDVYALGVLLYELATGQPPYEFTTRSPDEVRRIVCETEPKKPSSVRHRLPVDMDTVVLKAMHKEPQRRYASAEQLSEDVRRYLARLPLTARKDTFWYRTSKFARRHKVGTAAAALLAISMLGGVCATLWEAHVASIERTLAEQRFRDVRTLASSNLFEIHDAIAQLPGSAAARHLLIQRALEYLDKLNGQNTSDQETMRDLAAGYERIGDLQGFFSGPGIGDSANGIVSYEKAYRNRAALVKTLGNKVGELRAESSLLTKYIRALLLTGRTQEALQRAELALTVINQAAAYDPANRQTLAEQARAHAQLAVAMGGQGSSPSPRRLAEAIQHDQEAIVILDALLAKGDDVEARRTLGYAKMSLATHLEKSRRFDESLRVMDSALSEDVRNTVQAANMENTRGIAFERSGDQKKALEAYRTSFAILAEISRADPRNLDIQINLIIQKGHIAVQSARLGRPENGLADLTDLVGRVEKLIAADSSKLFYRNLLMVGYAYQAEMLSSMGERLQARTQYGKALAEAEMLAERDPIDLESRLSIAKLHTALGILDAKEDRYDDARQEFKLAGKLAGDLIAERPQDPEILYFSTMTAGLTSSIESCRAGSPCTPGTYPIPFIFN